MSTVSCIQAIAANSKSKVHQLDINDAFLHRDLPKEVYMMVPEGIDYKPNQVCLLKKSLYGLKH